MPPIDDKVVAMSFENSKFESGVRTTLSSLDKLKAALHFPNAGKGLQDINASSKKVDLSHIGKAIDDIRSKLGLLSVAALAVFANIAIKAVSAGTRMAKALTLDPLKAGFAEYTTNLNAVQTILANTQAAGVKLKDVNAALRELNEYSDKTIYNFSQMAKNIGTFTAAGVELDTSVAAIKGIANLAALSGSNADQASTAMYQLSQALAAGRVSLMDWNSVVNAGMGGTVFQRALANTAQTMGTLEKGAVKLVGPMKNVTIAGESFRNSLSTPGKEGWLTSDVLTKTLAQFTGDLKDAELAAMGFTSEQIMAIQQTAKTAQLAATEVKTLKQVIDVARETAGSGWAQTWQIIFGNFGEAKATFTALSNAINGFINVSADARNKVLGDWKALGGRTLLIESIKTAFHNLGLVVKPIKEAFRDIFPAATGKSLYELTVRFSEFTKSLKPGQETIDNLKRTFRGFFALLSIGMQIIGGIFTVFGQLFGAVGEGRSGFLNFTGSIGDFLVSVDAAMKKGNRFHNFFVDLGQVLRAPIDLLRAIGTALSDLFSGFSPGGFFQEIDGMNTALTPLQKIMAGIATGWGKLLEAIGNSGKFLRPVFEAIIELISGLGSAIGNAASNMNFDAILQVIRTGLFAGIFLMFKQFLGKGSLIEQISGRGGGFLANIRGKFMALQGTMQSLQTNLKAKTLKEIAIAIALMTASVVALSFVDAAKLKSALTAMAVGFGQLLGAMAILTAVTRTAGFIKLPFITASLILLAGAIDVLSVAVIALSFLSWEDLLKGLGGVGFLLAAISVAAIPLSANSAGMVRAGIGIMGIALALLVLSQAVKTFGNLSWTELSKGLIAVAVGLGVISAAAMVMPKSMVLTGVGLIAMAVGLRILAEAVEKFGSLDWRTIGKGLVGVGAALFIIAAAMQLMPKSMIFTAAGLVLVSFALGKISDVVKSMGGMSVREIAKGLVSLAGALAILAVALHVMSGTIGGAVALGIAATGLSLLAPAIIALGKQSWGQILKSMVALASAMALIGLAGMLVMPAIPALIGFGAALVLVGAGLALAGVGIALIGAGLSALVVSAPIGVGVLVAALVELAEAIPRIAGNLVLGMLEMVKAFAATAPQFVDAIVKILASLLDAVIKSAPKIAEAFNALIAVALKVLNDNQAKIIQAGFNLIVGLLQGIRNNIPQLVRLTLDIVSKFLSTIASNLGRVISSGVQILVSLLRGISNSIATVATAALSIITRFLSTIASNLGRIATAGLSILTKLLQAIASGLGNVIKAGTDIIVKFVQGIASAGAQVIKAGVDAITKFINAIVKGALKLIDAGAQAIINFLNGVADVLEQRTPEMRAAGVRVGVAIADGMTFGLASKAAAVAGKAASLAKGALSAAGGVLGLGSPSKEFFKIGRFVVMGFANGLSDSRQAVASAEYLGNSVIGMFNNVFQITSPSKVMHNIGKLVGQGFAQGLTGSTDDIKKAFTDMNAKLTEAMVATREIIAKEQDRLDKLRESKKPDLVAIKKSQDVIKENEALLARVTAGHNALVKSLKDEKKELIGLTKDYEKISEKLTLAKDVLANATRLREDAIKGFSDQYSTLPDIVTEDAEGNSVDQLATYMEALKHQADAVAAYQSTLDQLRKLGLDDATYQKLLEEGTANQQFASQLLAGGKTAVDSLNTLDANLMKVSKTLATNAAKNLYQAGVDAAEGLVKGLKSKQSKLRDAMEDLAREMVNALKKELKIKSPSEEFAKIGAFAMEGMARGFSNSSKVVTNAIDVAAQDALTAMQRSMRNISDAVTDGLDTNPVITPILDLTLVRSQSQELSALAKTPLPATTSLGQASLISSAQITAEAEADLAVAGGTSVKFEQNNFSPEALSEIEIYRQTKNQLSQLKSVLALT